MKKVAVIGGGWYGTHIALELAREGYAVTLYEKNPELFSEISGLFGIRLHVGPHYPRSEATRVSCDRGYFSFAAKYPELIVAHEFSVYAIGDRDADDQPSKVSPEHFVKVCRERSSSVVFDKQKDIEEKGYKNLLVAVDIDEPSIRIGRGLHKFFLEQLKNPKHLVTVACNSNILSVTKIPTEGIEIVVEHYDGEKPTYEKQKFDYIVNATSFQTLLPRSLNLPFEVLYQPCVALVYNDLKPTSEKPFSFIVMDGWFPCLMPAVEYGVESKSPPQYILTHGMWTIMASYAHIDDAKKHYQSIDDRFITDKVKPNCEKEITRFFPAFNKRFQYVKWIGAVIAKIKNNREFRSSITFQDNASEMIYVLPGKISNIFCAGSDVKSIIKGENIIRNKAGYSYVNGGTLDTAFPELQEKITERNTCNLQTFRMATDGGENPVTVTTGKKKPWGSIACLTSAVIGTVIFLSVHEYRRSANSPNPSPTSNLWILLGVGMTLFGVAAAAAAGCAFGHRHTFWGSRTMNKDNIPLHDPNKVLAPIKK